MWVPNCIQNLAWQGLQMSPENNIHFKKHDMKMTSASSLMTYLVADYPSCWEQLSSWKRYKEKNQLFEAIREYPKKRGLEMLRS